MLYNNNQSIHSVESQTDWMDSNCEQFYLMGNV